MGKNNLQVNLTFTADTKQAQAQLRSLQTELNNLMVNSTAGNNMRYLTAETQQAISAAAALKVQLQEATNVNTGKLDLNKLNNSLKNSGMSLKQYGHQLEMLGPQGVQAFGSITRAIANAEIPMLRLSGMVQKLGQTLANTMRWMISSNFLMAITSTTREAIDYMKDLNTSLNNIRIVTGQSVEQMERFAKKANEAAKALKTSTVAYTDAALIYYQQGLNDEQVEQRTKTTIKLANVVGESASTVSEWMTSIWNNFDNGAHSLEYYADVVTALGAATASSADEIAQGLEKFAAVADTVGLSYEYATSALATVTAETRQSADVVGTAFKTLFARIQDLELGKTLEDGTSLGQYSEALAKIGINIKTASGELKGMDSILEETGAKWSNLGKDQQVALAQSVAGIRQYAQFIALMDNWDAFQMNLQTANTSKGTLAEQQAIFEESWEGSKKRVKASAEDLYDALIDEDFFIDFNNNLADVIDLVKVLISAMNGLPGILSLVGTLILRIAGPQIAKGFDDIILRFQGMTKKGKEAQQALKQEGWQAHARMSTDIGTVSGGTRADATKKEAMLQEKLAEKAKFLNTTEQKRYATLIDIWRVGQEELIKKQEELELLEEEEATLRRILRIKYNISNTELSQLKDTVSKTSDSDAYIEKAATAETSQTAQKNLYQGLHSGIDAAMASQGQVYTEEKRARVEEYLNNGEMSFEELSQALPEVNSLKEVLEKVRTTINEIGKEGKKALGEDLKIAVEDACGEIAKLNTESVKTAKAGVLGSDKNNKNKAKAIDDYIGKVIESNKKGGKSFQDFEKKVKKSSKNLEKDIDSIGKKAPTIGQALTSSLQATTSMLFALQTLSSAATQLFDEGLKDGQSILTFITSVGMGVSMLLPGLKSMKVALLDVVGAISARTAVSAIDIATTKLQEVSHQKLTAALRSGTAEEKANRIATLLGVSADTAATIIAEKKAGATWKEAIAKGFETGETNKNTIATKINTFAKEHNIALSLIMLGVFAAIIGVVALLALGIKALANAYNADAIAAKEAAQSAQELADAYNSAKDAYEELKSSISDYKKAQTAIDAMVEGTEEWKDAVQEVNNQVLDLIAKYPELQGYVEILEGGRLALKDEGLEKINQQEKENLAILQNMSMYANQVKSETALQAEKTEKIRKEYSGSEWQKTTVNGYLLDSFREKAVRNTIDSYVKQMNEEGEEALLGLKDSLKDLGITSDKAVQEIQQLIRSEHMLGKQRENLSLLTTNNLLLSSGKIQTNGYVDNIQVLANKIVNKKLEDANIDIEGKVRRGEEITIGNKTKTIEDLTKDYAKQKYGIEDSDFGMRRVQQSVDGKVFFKIKSGDKKGRKYIDKSELQEYAEQLQTQANMDDIADEVNSLIGLSKELSYSQNAKEQAIGSWLQHGDLSYLDPKIYKKIGKDGIDEKTLEDFYNNNKDLISSLGMTETEIAESVNKAFNAFNEDLAEFNVAKQRWEKFNQTIKNGAETLDKSEASLRAYADTLIDTNKALVGNEEVAASAAVEHFRLAEGLSTTRKAIEEYSDVLNDANANSLEYAEAIGAIKKGLDKAFGTNISIDLIKSQMGTITSMLNGNEESFKKFRELLFSDWVANTLVLTDDTKKEVINGFNELIAEIDGKSIGVEINLDNTGLITGLNEALQNGSTTVEEIKAMFANAGLQFDESLVQMYSMPMTTKTTSVVTGTDGNGKPFSYTMNTTNSTETMFPWIGSNPPSFKMVGADDKATTTSDYVAVDSSGKTLQKGTEAYDQAVNEDGTFKAGTVVKKIGSGVSEKTIGGLKTMQTTGLEDILGYGLSDKRKENKEAIKNLKEEKELYRDIKEELEDIQRNLEEIEKKKDRAFGKDKLNYLQQEKALLKQQVEAQKEYVKQIQATKKAQYKKVDNYGFEFDKETGRILNYDKVYDKMLAKYKAALDSTGSTKKLKKWWDDFVSNTDKYSDTLDLLEDELVNLSDLKTELEDLEYEKLEYTVEIKTLVNDTGLKKIEFALGRIEDDAYKAAEAIGLLGEQANLQLNNFNTSEQAIRDLLIMKGASSEAIEKFMSGDASGLFGLNLNEQDFDLLQEYSQNLMDNYEAIEETFNGIFDAMDAVFEKINEEFEQLTSTLEHSQSVLESYLNIIELTGNSILGISDSMHLDIIDSQLSIANASIATAKEQYNKNLEMLAQAREGLAAATTEEEKRQWEESIELYEEQVRESEQAWLDALQNGLELSNQRREKAINVAIKEFLKENTGYGSMEELQQIYSQQKELRDLYVADYEKIYSLSKLSRQLEKSIDDTDSLNAKKALLELEEKINKAKAAGVKLSSYELQNLENEYQIELAKIALEEARNAKSMVRLVRNSEGGMSYLYTADQDALADAQQKYEDAVYNSQKANEQWRTSAEESLMSVTETYIEQLAVINTATYDSEEERDKALAELNEWYLAQQEFYTGQIDIVLSNNADLYNTHVATMGNYYNENDLNFKTMTDSMIDNSDTFVTHFKDTLLGSLASGLLGETDSAKAYYKELVNTIGGKDNPDSLLGRLQSAQDVWEQDTKLNFSHAGVEIRDFKTHVNEYLGENGVKKIIDNVSKSIDTLKNKSEFSQAQKNATTYAKEVAKAMEKAKEQIINVADALGILVDNWGDVDGLNDIDKTIRIKTVKTSSDDTKLPGGQNKTKINSGGYDDRDKDNKDNEDKGYSLTIKKYGTYNGGYAAVLLSNNKWYSARGLGVNEKDNKLNSKVYVAPLMEKQNISEDRIDFKTARGKTFTKIEKGLLLTPRTQSFYKESTDYFEWKGNTYVQVPGTDNWVSLNDFNVNFDDRRGLVSIHTGAQAYNLVRYDTGGYTGEWGPDGRLAMLHQKEIVLNAHDTENILQVVDIVRQLATKLDFNALSMARGLGDLIATTKISTGNQQLDQNVTITAEFPNATNREEIREAFGDLVNLAAQYANRK